MLPVAETRAWCWQQGTMLRWLPESDALASRFGREPPPIDPARQERRVRKANTTAFALDPGRIYLHREGRYPRGRVDRVRAEKLLTQIADVFLALEVDGRKVIRAAHRKEDIYAGPFLSEAPDLVLVAAEGFNLRGRAPADVLAEKSFFTGKHTPDTAFLLVRGSVDGKPLPPRPTVSDIKAIVESRRSVVGP